jgi:hypothetical protein
MQKNEFIWKIREVVFRYQYYDINEYCICNFEIAVKMTISKVVNTVKFNEIKEILIQPCIAVEISDPCTP